MVAHYSIRTGPALRERPLKRKTPAGANRQGQAKTKTQVRQSVKCLNCLDRVYFKPVSRKEGKLRIAAIRRMIENMEVSR